MWRFWLVAGIAFACLVNSHLAQAGPVLDDILNAMQLDQSLQKSGDDIKDVTREGPLGQTFVTGENVERVCRIAVRVAYSNEEWQPDETLVMTLWDGPSKKSKLGRFDIPYSRRQWAEGILMFSVEGDVKAKQQYYFELTVEGGNGKIDGVVLSKHDIDYPGGGGYEGGKPMDRELWFETHVKKTADRDANLLEFFDNFNLDYPGLEKVKSAVEARDWDAACKEFLKYIEDEKELFEEGDATPTLDPEYDTTLADLVVDKKWRASDGSILDLGPNWNYSASWPAYGGVGLTRTGLMKPLAFTYTNTGDERYARTWNAMLKSMLRELPCPLKSGLFKGEGRFRAHFGSGVSGGHGMWASISIAARMHHETFYNRFRKSPLFEEDVRMAWWSNLADMVNTLERMNAGGNWETQNMSALFGFARKYPEFKKSKKWFSQGFEGLKANFIDNMYPDGPCKEATTGYHSFSLGMFFDVYKTAREMDLDVPNDHLKRLETSFAYTMYTAMPNWQLPVWGDTNRPMDPTGLIGLGADYFDRSDMLWVSTKGKEGTKPEKTSIEFPTAGYYVMRSGWDPQARFLVTRNGYSQSHYHSDQLSVIVNAYGLDLLPDAGIYTYGTPECNELTRTKTHSTISVDGKNIAPGAGENTWASLPGFDYFDGTSPGYRDLPDVRHRRAIVFVKPDYWVVADQVTGPGEHTASQYWHFAPGEVSFDTSSGIARTKNSTGGNIAVIPLHSAGRNDELKEDVYAISWEAVVHDAPVTKHERKGSLPLAFCTVLFPYPASSEGEVEVKELVCKDASPEKGVMGACVTHTDGVDYVAFNASGQAVNLNPGRVRMWGEAATIRTTKSGKVRGFSWYGGSGLMLDTTLLASCGSPTRGLDVSYSGDAVTVTAEGASNDLMVAVLGAKKAVVNGKVVKLAKGVKMFNPFDFVAPQ